VFVCLRYCAIMGGQQRQQLGGCAHGPRPHQFSTTAWMLASSACLPWQGVCPTCDVVLLFWLIRKARTKLKGYLLLLTLLLSALPCLRVCSLCPVPAS
jgi:hypothetical protein